MIGEALHWLAARAAPGARAVGLVHEAVAVTARHARCREAWSPHLDASAEFIVRHALARPRRRTALLLGAGTCLDIPIAELATAYERVILVDAVVLAGAARRLRAHRNVSYCLRDVTGVLAALVQTRTAAELTRIEQQPPGDLLADPTVDFVASVNLLSQLPRAPMAWLARRRYATPAAIHELGLRILRAHLDYLSRFAATRVLICDAETWWEGADGRRDTLTMLRGLLRDYPAEDCLAWTWEVAPRGELRKGIVRHLVEARAWRATTPGSGDIGAVPAG